MAVERTHERLETPVMAIEADGIATTSRAKAIEHASTLPEHTSRPTEPSENPSSSNGGASQPTLEAT